MSGRRPSAAKRRILQTLADGVAHGWWSATNRKTIASLMRLGMLTGYSPYGGGGITPLGREVLARYPLREVQP